MEADINVIAEVEPGEATLLIGLIESLLAEWYVARHDRDERMARLKAAAMQKNDRQHREATCIGINLLTLLHKTAFVMSAELPPILHKYCDLRGLDILTNLRLKVTPSTSSTIPSSLRRESI